VQWKCAGMTLIIPVSSHSHGIIPMESFPWNHSHGIIPMESFPWNHSHGIIPMESFPWNHSHGIIPMESFPWNHSHGIIPMELFPWNYSYRIILIVIPIPIHSRSNNYAAHSCKVIRPLSSLLHFSILSPYSI